MTNKTTTSETTNTETELTEQELAMLGGVQPESEGQTLAQIVEDGLTKELYSPYELAKAVNAILKALGVLHEFGTEDAPGLRPQMFYNYVGNGMIKATGVKGDKGRKILKADALIWANGNGSNKDGYFKKNVLPKLQELSSK
jgi:hypothetical protein